MVKRTPFFVGCLLLAGIAGCGARSASLVSSGRLGTGALEERSARHKPGLNGETGADTRVGENPGNDGSSTIVIGFVGGFVRKDNAAHSPVKIAARLRASYPSGVHAEVFENHHREDAFRRVIQLLDVSHDGKLSVEEKRDARIIIYGMSWGGSETLALANKLQEQHIPVLLTIQVDSVQKLGENDGLIPANVGTAVNFYQTDGLLHGRAQVRAVDPSRTQILGNFRYAYKANPLACKEYPWWDQWFTKYHTQIECDPAVWDRVEGLIREKIPVAEIKNASAGPG